MRMVLMSAFIPWCPLRLRMSLPPVLCVSISLTVSLALLLPQIQRRAKKHSPPFRDPARRSAE